MTTNNKLNVALSGQTGTVNFVGSTSPTLITPTIGAASATSLTFSSTTGVKGSTTNDSAAAGSVGELISSTVLVGSAVSLTLGGKSDVTSITLTAGDWDVFGTVCTTAGAGTLTSRVAGWISTTSATFPTAPNNGAYTYRYISTGAGDNTFYDVGKCRISASGNTIVYLTAACNFTVSTLAAYGFIGARRVR